MEPRGIFVRTSPYNVKDTIDRFYRFLQKHGATIYARIDQQEEVRKSGQDLNALEFILFGNPKAGGPFMAKNPLVALDLPLKIIAWEDDQGSVWIACNTSAYIEERYFLPHRPDSQLDLEKLINSVLNP